MPETHNLQYYGTTTEFDQSYYQSIAKMYVQYGVRVSSSV